MKTRGKIFIAVLVLAATIFIWTSLPNNVYEDVYSGEFDEPITQGNNEEISWRDITLKDTLTSQEYKISDYDGQVIILETFAVWCPTCRKQQQEIKKLIDSGDNSIHISLDIDPNDFPLACTADNNIFGDQNVLDRIRRHGAGETYLTSDRPTVGDIHFLVFFLAFRIRRRRQGDQDKDPEQGADDRFSGYHGEFPFLLLCRANRSQFDRAVP